jgi:hypothetical protein
MSRIFVVMVLFGFTGIASADDSATLRARAALALAFAPADTKPPTYAEQYAKALKDGKPLLVWVGQPVRPVIGCVAVRLDEFPGVGPEAVVVGVPTGRTLRRVDLPGKPTDAAVKAAVRAAQREPDPTSAMLPVK